MITHAEMTTEELQRQYNSIIDTIAKFPDANRDNLIRATAHILISLGTELNKREADAMIANRTLNPRA